MKKQQNKVDEFFREALHDHKIVPSEAAKAAFLKEAATMEGNGKFNTYLYFFLSAVLLLGLISAGIFMARRGHSVKRTSSFLSNSIGDKKNKSHIIIKQTELHPTGKQEVVTIKNFTQKTNIHLQNRDKKNVTPSNFSPRKRNDFASLDSSSLVVEKSKTSTNPFEHHITPPATELNLRADTKPLSNENGKNDSLKVLPAKQADTLITEKTTGSDPKPVSGSTPKNWNVAIGGYYAPEWLFNTLEGEKYVNNFGIEGTFNFGRYSIRTGAGLSITKGTNELSVNYNDYLGHYNKLDSIQFTWNDTHSKLVPTYYFSHENVWDSLLKTADARVVKRYTYLQVPLILGYDFWQNDRFSIGLRGGPILSVLLKTEVLSDNYDPGKNRIILINRIAPERIQINWQILGGINATFHFSHRLSFELEPEIRYYFNSVYEKSAINKKPWSVGIRAAFIVIL